MDEDKPEDVILLDDDESYQQDKFYIWGNIPLANDTMNSNSNEIQTNDLLEEDNESAQFELQASQSQDTLLYQCSVCKKAYKSKYYVKYHEKKAHGDIIMDDSTTSISNSLGVGGNPVESLQLEENNLSNTVTNPEDPQNSAVINQDVVLISDSDSDEDKKMNEEYGTLTLQANDTDFQQHLPPNFIIIMNGDQLGEFSENGFLQVPEEADAENFILPDNGPLNIASVKLNSNIFICDEGDCKMPFPHEKLLRNHKLMVHKRRSFTKCKFCKEGFLTKRDMKIHLEQTHENGNNKYRICGVCQEKFDDSTEFYQHFFTHPNANICYICGVHFDYNTSLLLHQKTHRTHEKPRAQIICQICGMSYFLESSYQKHYDICCKILEEKKRHE